MLLKAEGSPDTVGSEFNVKTSETKTNLKYV